MDECHVSEMAGITLKELCWICWDEYDLSAKSVASHFLARHAELDHDIHICVGEGYDGATATAMSGHISGVHVLIHGQVHLAMYVHCSLC